MSFAEVNGTQVHYQRLGEGKLTVVFLHGLVMDNLSSWFFTTANAAAQLASVLVYDLRGHGFSARPKSGYTVSDHLVDLEQLLSQFKIHSRVLLVGNSYGGLLALNYASLHPTQVAGLVLVDAHLNDEPWKQMMTRSLGLQGEAADAAIGANFQNWLGRTSSRKSNRLAKNAGELIRETSLVADIERSNLLNEDQLKKITVPVTGIYGENSDILHVAKKLEMNLPQFRLKIFPGSSHSVLWENTDEVKSIILAKIAEVRDA